MPITPQQFAIMEARVASNRKKSLHYEQTSVSPAVHPLPAIQQKPDGLQPLVEDKPKREKRKGRVRVVVTLIACRGREVDDDGNVAGLFHWRDAIAKRLGIDDGDRRIRWIYGQIETRGESGIIIKIEAV